MVKISVVIPVYNGAKYLASTVESLLTQSIADIEIIIVNDGSTDDTGYIIEMLVEEDIRVKAINKFNTGVSDTRNIGLENASGEYIVFFDADDIALPNFLEERLTFLEENQKYGVCGSRIGFIDEHNNVIDQHRIVNAPGKLIHEDILSFNPEVAAIPSNLMIRKAVITENDILFNLQLNSSADKYFLYNTGKYTQSYSLPNVSLNYRLHLNSMSSKLTKARFFDSLAYVSLVSKDYKAQQALKLIFLKKSYYILAVMAYKLGLYFYTAKFGFSYLMLRKS